jgi:hypothetical protein
MWMDGRTNKIKLIVAFHNFANAPKIYSSLSLLQLINGVAKYFSKLDTEVGDGTISAMVTFKRSRTICFLFRS